MTETTRPDDESTSDTPDTSVDESIPEGGWDDDSLADEMSEESFPTSDPPSTWAGEDHG